METELHGEPVHPSQLKRAMSNYNAQGVPVQGHAPHPSMPGMMVVIISIPAGAPAPDWRTAPPPAPAPRVRRFDWRLWVQVACAIVVIAGMAYLFIAAGPDADPLAKVPAPAVDEVNWWDGLRLPWQQDAPGEPVVEPTGGGFQWPWEAAQDAIDGAVNVARLLFAVVLLTVGLGALLYLMRQEVR